MTYKLTCVIDHKDFDEPITHTYKMHGETRNSIVEDVVARMNQAGTMDTQDKEFHKRNFNWFGRTAFKSTDGAKHSWKLKKVKEPG